MNKNYGLYAVAALFALLGTNVQADVFDFLRPEEQRELPGGEKRPVFPGLVETETRGGGRAIEVQPLESIFGGYQEGRDYQGRDYRDDRRSNRAYDYYE